jgi:hypothetical protein
MSSHVRFRRNNSDFCWTMGAKSESLKGYNPASQMDTQTHSNVESMDVCTKKETTLNQTPQNNNLVFPSLKIFIYLFLSHFSIQQMKFWLRTETENA